VWTLPPEFFPPSQLRAVITEKQRLCKCGGTHKHPKGKTLQMLPPEKIAKRFLSLIRTCSGKMMKFCKYIERNWINSKTWPPKTGVCSDKTTLRITTSKVGKTTSTKEKNDAFNLFRLIDHLHHKETLIVL
jgi:hypothetical protein